MTISRRIERWSADGKTRLATYDSMASVGRDAIFLPGGIPANSIKYSLDKGTVYRGYIWKSVCFEPIGLVKEITVRGMVVEVSTCGLFRTKLKDAWMPWREGEKDDRGDGLIYYNVSFGTAGKDRLRRRVHWLVAYAFLEKLSGMNDFDSPALDPSSTYEEFLDECDLKKLVIDHINHPAIGMRSNDIRNLRLVTCGKNARLANAKQKDSVVTNSGTHKWSVDGTVFGSLRLAVYHFYPQFDSHEKVKKFTNSFLSPRRNREIHGRYWERVVEGDLNGEEWKEGKYQNGDVYMVSNLGRVRTKRKTGFGCLRERYYRWGKKSIFVHRLVATIWCADNLRDVMKRTGLPVEKLVVRHILKRGIPDNRAVNLEWGTSADNNDDNLKSVVELIFGSSSPIRTMTLEYIGAPTKEIETLFEIMERLAHKAREPRVCRIKRRGIDQSSEGVAARKRRARLSAAPLIAMIEDPGFWE